MFYVSNFYAIPIYVVWCVLEIAVYAIEECPQPC